MTAVTDTTSTGQTVRQQLIYGVGTAELEIPDDLTGVDDQQPTLIKHGNLAAIVGVVEAEQWRARRAELIGYNRVLNALAAQGPVAPVRFGTVVDSAQQVVDDLLAPQQEELSGLLAELVGRAQYNVRATYDEDSVLAEVLAANPAIRELNEQTRGAGDEAYAARVQLGELVAQAMQQRAERDASLLLEEILPLAQTYSLRSDPSHDQVLDLALLIDIDQRARFEQRLEELAADWHRLLRLQLIGPIAPYDFVGG